MRWIKGIDRQPKKEVFIRIEGTKAIGHWSTHHKMFINESGDFFPEDQIEWLDESLPADDMTTTLQNEPVTFLLSNALRHLTQDQQRQLCNALQERLPVPASITDEADRLYPANSDDIIERLHDHTSRAGYITCARQYMGEIERLKNLIKNLYDTEVSEPCKNAGASDDLIKSHWNEFKEKHNL